jgi:PhzF family phenazine biosynthesis protein
MDPASVASSLHVVSVFAVDGHGGNPATIGLDVDRLSTGELQDLARQAGHECGFVLPPPAGSAFHAAFRFFVPRHEMEMCGHATVGALWVLHHLGRWPADRDRFEISTLSGRVTGRIAHRGTPLVQIAISQPRGRISPLPDPAADSRRIASVLGVAPSELATSPIVNASTSRVKTLVPLTSADAVQALRPEFARIEALCEDLGSTGLYPYAAVDLPRRIFEARQFPKASGYPEDPATGIAASALAFGLLEHGLVTASEAPISIYQGRAMGQLSRIEVSFQHSDALVSGCWITGDVVTRSAPEHTAPR